MREIVHLQIGQSGNQIGTKVSLDSKIILCRIPSSEKFVIFEIVK